VIERPEVYDHVGLLSNRPSRYPGLPLITAQLSLHANPQPIEVPVQDGSGWPCFKCVHGNSLKTRGLLKLSDDAGTVARDGGSFPNWMLWALPPAPSDIFLTVQAKPTGHYFRLYTDTSFAIQ
jgi:hypothetical protein